MFNHEIFAVSFARTIDLLRTGAPVEQQKSSLRAVYALTSLASAMVRVYQDMLTVDDVGIPDSLPFVPRLIQQMRDHQVAEVAIAKGATPTELLALIRGLAAEPSPEGGVLDLKKRLRDVRSTAIMVIPLQPEESDTGRRGPSVTQAFEAAAIEEAMTAADSASVEPPQPPGPRLSFEFPAELPAAMPSIEFAMDEPAEPEVAAAEPPAATPLEGLSAAAEMLAAPPAGAPAPRQLEPSVEQLEPQVISAETPLGQALAHVARDPYGTTILDRLTDLSDQIQLALREDKIQAALHAMSAVIAWEPEAPAGSPRNSYAIVLRRMLTREVLAQVAQFVADARLGPEATKVMQRGRSDAAEVLLGLLATAETMKERKAYMTALREMPDGLSHIVHMLEHTQWFVVRNVADLMGEQRVEEAVPDLGRCLTHSDPRVRRAAAVALAKIGSAATVEPLRRVLKEGDRELRALIAGSIGGHKSRALAMPLVALAEQEQDVDVLREYYRALGRIGTPDAVQALAKAAQPGGRLLGRRPSGPRVAAVDGLRIAGGQAAAAALQGLAADGDKAVRELARRALEELKTRDATITA